MRASRFLPNNDFARCNCFIQGGEGEKKHCIVILMEQSASLPAVMSISGKTHIFLNPQRPRLKEHFRHQATGGAALRFRSVVMEMQLLKFQAKLFLFSPLPHLTSLFCPFCKQVVRDELGKQQLQREPIEFVSSRCHILEAVSVCPKIGPMCAFGRRQKQLKATRERCQCRSLTSQGAQLQKCVTFSGNTSTRRNTEEFPKRLQST